jgi:hypothetical protein
MMDDNQYKLKAAEQKMAFVLILLCIVLVFALISFAAFLSHM